MWGNYIIEEKMSDQNKWPGWRLRLEKGRFWGKNGEKMPESGQNITLSQYQANTDSEHISDDLRLCKRRKLIWMNELAEDWDSNMVNFGEKRSKND